MHIWQVYKYVDEHIDSHNCHIPGNSVSIGFFTNISYAARAAFKEINRMSHRKKNTIFSVKDMHFCDDKTSVIIHLKKWEDKTEDFLKVGRYDCLDEYGRSVLKLNGGDYIVITKVPVDKDIW